MPSRRLSKPPALNNPPPRLDLAALYGRLRMSSACRNGVRQVVRDEPKVAVARGIDRNEFSFGRQFARGVAARDEKGEGGLDPVTGARQMLLRQLDQHGWPKAPQGVLSAAQQGELPALDVGLDEIDAVDRERGDDRIERCHRHQLLLDRRPAALRPAQM